jgi:hypothetical protein
MKQISPIPYSNFNKLHDFIPTVTLGKCSKAVASGKILPPRPSFFTISPISIVIDTNIMTASATTIVDVELVAAIWTSMVFHA